MITRRQALQGAAGLAMATAAPMLSCQKPDDVPAPRDSVFGYGVASGDPEPDGVIIWTRATHELPVGGRWEVATDATFTAIVASGVFETDGDRDWTVKVDVRGLSPATTYFYRFTTLGHTSPIGRTRTAPVNPDRLRFAVVSCASLPHGYFQAYRGIAQRTDIDAVIHLGDYIYEYAAGKYGKIRESDPPHEVLTLEDYRLRYAQYRRDPDLQECHRQHPFINIWDDHEFIDNAWSGGATGDDPLGGPWEARRIAASRAFSEWIPIRDQPDGKIWRKLSYGNLADLFFLDTRIWHRDIQVPATHPALADPARELMGADQEAWLASGLATSTARWKVVCQQVMMVNVPAWFRDDGWDDYPAARARFYDMISKQSVANVVVLSGDVHTSWASELTRAPDQPAVAVELITPSITAPGPKSKSAVELQSGAPWVKYVDLERHGYVLLTLLDERAHGAWYYAPNIERAIGAVPAFAVGFATLANASQLTEDKNEPAPFVGPPLAPDSPT